MKLKNRIAIITGGSPWHWPACAERFVAEGAHVVIPDVLDEVGKTEAKRLGATYMHCDVSKSSDITAVVAAVVKQHGAVDILLNNAAINISGDFLEVSEADYDKVLDINLKGSFLMLQACAREMVKQVLQELSSTCLQSMTPSPFQASSVTASPRAASRS